MAIPKVYSIESLNEGYVEKLSFSINQDHMEMFAQLSGDINPIHTSSKFAQNKGFQDTVVYGALMVAKLSQMIGMHLPGRDALWNGLKINFINPLMVDQEAELITEVAHISVATSSIELKFEINANGKIIAKGSASVMIYLGTGNTHE